MRDTRYGNHQGRTTPLNTPNQPQYAGYLVAWGDLMASGGALMAKKVVGDVMIIQKNADARTHPRPPAS